MIYVLERREQLKAEDEIDFTGQIKMGAEPRHREAESGKAQLFEGKAKARLDNREAEPSPPG